MLAQLQYQRSTCMWLVTLRMTARPLSSLSPCCCGCLVLPEYSFKSVDQVELLPRVKYTLNGASVHTDGAVECCRRGRGGVSMMHALVSQLAASLST
jgi:hypothetical protein